MNAAKAQAVFDATVEKYVNSEKNYIRMQAGINVIQENAIVDQNAAALKAQFKAAADEPDPT
ncbi:hypothetical protein GZH47_33290 (plasmid) [Paenibacillus rhizovicinus]|uniref:Uncharacterized protein n=1 Tax=Paenibacillus rhizovicinus TaxID=2704463 RepID=A0A6C0PB15_9BACL|nr:hypothetical protein [Paenibacillus rhizovicinus]QHW35770.1 hypothetical protein GZH47_33290 [Paenibacillus rhizovicinus]